MPHSAQTIYENRRALHVAHVPINVLNFYGGVEHRDAGILHILSHLCIQILQAVFGHIAFDAGRVENEQIREIR